MGVGLRGGAGGAGREIFIYELSRRLRNSITTVGLPVIGGDGEAARKPNKHTAFQPGK